MFKFTAKYLHRNCKQKGNDEKTTVLITKRNILQK